MISIPYGFDQILFNSSIFMANSRDVDLLKSMNPNHIVFDILNIFIPSANLEDKQIWGLCTDGFILLCRELNFLKVLG